MMASNRQFNFSSAFACILLLVGGLSGPVFADDGSFVVKQVDTRLEEGVYYLDADFSHQLSDTALEALHNGVPLFIEIKVEVFTQAWGGWASTFAELIQRYTLRYHSLSRQYVLKNLNADTQEIFSSVSTALVTLNVLRNLPIIDKKLLDDEPQYLVRTRTRLEIESLPLPLRSLAYFKGSWRLKSDWYTWPLDD